MPLIVTGYLGKGATRLWVAWPRNGIGRSQLQTKDCGSKLRVSTLICSCRILMVMLGIDPLPHILCLGGEPLHRGHVQLQPGVHPVAQLQKLTRSVQRMQHSSFVMLACALVNISYVQLVMYAVSVVYCPQGSYHQLLGLGKRHAVTTCTLVVA